ncbi:MAG: hypothetical protein NTY98_16565 [Verrucomicrobia bacterium]|nr:hypothetical protein [Verrucomicrobiota bacterium]
MKIIPSALLLTACLLQARAETSLTIYNQKFGVVRDSMPLDLKQGVNQVRFADTTAHLEPDSVILRDPKSGVKLSILEQNYRADPVSPGLLLDLNEGKEIEFFVKESNKPDRIVTGKVIRSGYVAHPDNSSQSYFITGEDRHIVNPVIEVEGRLQFSLPGEPRFPALGDDTILKPTLDWRIHADKAAKFDAELCYVTSGMSWEADYNVVSPEKGELIDLTGWVTIVNQTGKTFKDAKLQLIAGDVAKLSHQTRSDPYAAGGMAFADSSGPPRVTEKAFDEFHLYSLPLPSTLHDRETKQVEFVRAAGVKAQRLFIYDGVAIDRDRGSRMENIRNDESYGTQSNPKVWIMREIKNSSDNHLGLPLPKGKVRFYRQDSDGRLQFVGEDMIDHTARDETLRLYTGNAFDLVGERKRITYKTDSSNHWIDESFEIKVRNRKQDEAVEIRVVEHLYRATNWEIRDSNNTHLKTDAQTIEFRIPLKAGEERTITYTAHYSW